MTLNHVIYILKWSNIPYLMITIMQSDSYAWYLSPLWFICMCHIMHCIPHHMSMSHVPCIFSSTIMTRLSLVYTCSLIWSFLFIVAHDSYRFAYSYSVNIKFLYWWHLKHNYMMSLHSWNMFERFAISRSGSLRFFVFFSSFFPY